MVSASLLLFALATAAAATPAPRHDPNQMICVRQPDTASRIAPPRMCRTRAAWEDYRRDMRNSVERVQNHPQGRCIRMSTLNC